MIGEKNQSYIFIKTKKKRSQNTNKIYNLHTTTKQIMFSFTLKYKSQKICADDTYLTSESCSRYVIETENKQFFDDQVQK